MEIFETRNDMLGVFQKNLKICELGVFEGDFSKDLYRICLPDELHLVDLFEGYFGSGDKDGNNYHYVQLEEELEKIREFFKNNKEVKIFKSLTTDFLLSNDDEYFDLIYIDADHSYNSVLSDLLIGFNKVKTNGFICGHDYVRETEAKKAVDDFCKLKNLKIEFLTNDGCPSFCIIKK